MHMVLITTAAEHIHVNLEQLFGVHVIENEHYFWLPIFINYT